MSAKENKDQELTEQEMEQAAGGARRDGGEYSLRGDIIQTERPDPQGMETGRGGKDDAQLEGGGSVQSWSQQQK